MPKRERRYRVVVEGPTPDDLAERCAAVWRDIRLAAQHAVVAARRVQEPQAPGEALGASLAARARTSRSPNASSTLAPNNGKP